VLRGPDERHVTNTSLLFDAAGKRVARYDKIHLFDVTIPGRDEQYRESTHVAPGRKIVLADTPVGRLGLSVCYDMRFPELYRDLVAQGAEWLSMPAAFTVPTGRAHWETLLRARAIENLCYVVAPAQSGTHSSGRETYGDSLIVDYWGQVMSRLAKGSGVITADFDLGKQAETRVRFPALDNRQLGLAAPAPAPALRRTAT
jgi:predicted amidohydrolase